MFEGMSALTLARIQFAFTVSFHIIFTAFSIRRASWLPVLEWRWLKTGNTVYAEIYRMWVKIFVVTFGGTSAGKSCSHGRPLGCSEGGAFGALRVAGS